MFTVSLVLCVVVCFVSCVCVWGDVFVVDVASVVFGGLCLSLFVYLLLCEFYVVCLLLLVLCCVYVLLMCCCCCFCVCCCLLLC